VAIYTPWEQRFGGDLRGHAAGAPKCTRLYAWLVSIPLILASGLVPLAAADIEFVTQELPWAIADKPYAPAPLQVRSSGSCGHGGVGFTVVGGSLPPGLELSKLGYFSGSPLRTGDFSFGIRVSNGCTWAVKRFTLTVTGSPVVAVSPTRLFFTGGGEKTVRISSTWPRLLYRAVPSAEWLKIAPAHGFTPRPSSALIADDAQVTVDASGLKPGHYSATIAIEAWQASEAAQVSVELEVTGKPEPSGTPTSASQP
jgi:hypothetical protein